MNSKLATQFRIWATQVLKEHIVKGYSINEKRLKETRGQLGNLQKTIALLHKTSQKDMATDQSHEILSLLANYSKTLSTLFILFKATPPQHDPQTRESASDTLETPSCFYALSAS